jgi:TRAP-type mannitol/chloroaromatic compound transport system permease small subunit
MPDPMETSLASLEEAGNRANPRAPKPSLFGAVIDGLNGLGSAIIIAIMVLVCADVVARGLLNQPIDGVAELVALAIIAVVFLQLASTLRHGRMTRADLFIDGFRKRHPLPGGVLEAVFDVAGIAVCGIIVWASWPKFMASWTGNEFIGIQGQFTAPTWPVRAIVILGAGLAAVQYGLHMIQNLRLALSRRTA